MLSFAIVDSQNALWSLCLAVAAGCFLTVLARRLHLPTIVLLLLGGFAFGAEGLGILNAERRTVPGLVLPPSAHIA